MTDNDLIRRGDVTEMLLDEGWYGNTLSRLDALPDVQTFTAADLEAAFRLALEMAAKVQVRTWDDQVTHDVHLLVQQAILSQTPPDDLAARVKSQGDELAKPTEARR